MTLGRPVPAYHRQIGIDTDSILSVAALAEIAADPAIEFVGRYVDSLTAEEVARIFARKLAILPLTYANEYDPEPRLRKLAALGCPTGVTVVLDVESVKLAPAALVVHINAWASATKAASCDPAGYVGAGAGLTADEWSRTLVDRYMRSCSFVPEPIEGFCCEQLSPGNTHVHGVDKPVLLVDYDVMRQDYRGRVMSLWGPEP
ncbi:MAG: hypothetical protein ACYCPT_01895 [Acidimicrobiales bacterium]